MEVKLGKKSNWAKHFGYQGFAQFLALFFKYLLSYSERPEKHFHLYYLSKKVNIHNLDYYEDSFLHLHFLVLFFFKFSNLKSANRAARKHL